MKKITSLCFLIIISCFTQAQFSFSYDQVKSRLAHDIEVLSHDSMEGRQAGTAGERRAAAYIVAQFEAMKLSPYFKNDSFRQAFSIVRGFDYSESYLSYTEENRTTKLTIEQAFPIDHSLDTMLNEVALIDVSYGISAPKKSYDNYKDKDVKGKVVLIERGSPKQRKWREKLYQESVVYEKIKQAIAHGAAGIILYAGDDELTALNPYRYTSKKETIPIMYLDDYQEIEHLKRAETISLYTKIKQIRIDCYNLVGMIDNQAGKTIYIGAHYDHLGYGSFGSLEGDLNLVHNGADDNASGTAAVLELMRHLKVKGSKKVNYVFIAFSAEELGLIGSGNFVSHPEFDASKALCMLNIDMIGRLDVNKKLMIYGTNTGDLWQEIIKKSNPEFFDLNVKKKKMGFGMSDHYSFYKEKIPVLFFFTGIHSDYHRHSDDFLLINQKGCADIVLYIEKLILTINQSAEIQFQEK